MPREALSSNWQKRKKQYNTQKRHRKTLFFFILFLFSHSSIVTIDWSIAGTWAQTILSDQWKGVLRGWNEPSLLPLLSCLPPRNYIAERRGFSTFWLDKDVLICPESTEEIRFAGELESKLLNFFSLTIQLAYMSICCVYTIWPQTGIEKQNVV